MTRKTAEAYHAVFKYIEDNLIKLQPAEMMTDYEEGLRLAIKNCWPNTRIRGCLWHYERAIDKKCKSLGMTKFFKKNKHAKKVKAMLSHLPLLPENLLIEGYQSIKKFARNNRVDRRFARVFSYFESYWLKKVRLQSVVIILWLRISYSCHGMVFFFQIFHCYNFIDKNDIKFIKRLHNYGSINFGH